MNLNSNLKVNKTQTTSSKTALSVNSQENVARINTFQPKVETGIVQSKLMRIVFFNRECYFWRHLLTSRLLANVQIDRYMIVIANAETRTINF